MPGTKSLPATIFDHMVWFIETGDGSWRRVEILLGECLVLFTSLDTLHAFIEGCDARERAAMRAAVFSRNRKEFGRRARQAVKAGVIGALIDPAPECGEAPFLRFAKPATPGSPES
jgi:hypothetical protein